MNLTDKQEGFAITYVMNGGNATEAYEEWYDVKEDTKKTTTWSNAYKLLNTTQVSTRVAELQMMENSATVSTILERKQVLSKLVRSGDTKAIDLLNKMEGIYTEKLELSGKLLVKRKIIVNPTKAK